MGVLKKLSLARSKVHSAALKKTGRNEYNGANYFEMEDFLPQTLRAFAECGIIGVVSFSASEATLKISDLEDQNDSIVISSPMASANLKGCHDVQNLGAVHKYLRRYLWAIAIELIENDILDAANYAENDRLWADGRAEAARAAASKGLGAYQAWFLSMPTDFKMAAVKSDEHKDLKALAARSALGPEQGG